MATTLVTFMRRTVAPALAAGALAGILVACGDGGGGGNGGGDSTTSATQVNVKMTDFRMQLPQTTLKAGEYTFVATNDGHHDHAMEIEGQGTEQKTRTLAPGESANLTITLKDGMYEVFCPVGNHKDLGMKTELTVGGTSTSDGSGY
ncbi:cupredoxin domain-containing protein [Streptomyces spongiae]|uniref:Copper-binding protein n=1 Tax=Streptomyces spongiae TaxID=565072 RepID=A0A5N8XEU8_9ACTN|nr:cupredoxin domain-containing protein [Streptomyces spongiae]MPY57887.1 copper-binding protein [Streptomyces spongiae]